MIAAATTTLSVYKSIFIGALGKKNPDLALGLEYFTYFGPWGKLIGEPWSRGSGGE